MKFGQPLGITQIVFFVCLICSVDGIKNASNDVRPKPLWGQTGVDKLKKDLLTNYDKYARPQEHDQVTEVKIGMSIMNVETEESKSSVAVSAMLRLQWNDIKLKWNTSEYENITVLHVADHEVWQPDIYLYNSASGSSQLPRYGNPNILAYPNGVILWVPPVKLIALCDFDMEYWPFDVQHCYLKLASWVYNGNEISLGLYNNATSATLEQLINVSEWKVATTAEVELKKYDCCEEVYPSVMYNLTLTRKTKSYSATFIAPAIVATFFILLQFWLPPDASEKIFLNAFAIVILNMFIIYLNHKVIGVGTKTPLIVLFYSRCLIVVAITTLMAVTMYCLSRIQKTSPVPTILHKLMQTRLGQVMYLELDIHEVGFFWMKKGSLQTRNDVTEIRRFSDCREISKLSVWQQWHVLTVVVDRILFLFCTIALLIMAIVYA